MTTRDKQLAKKITVTGLVIALASMSVVVGTLIDKPEHIVRLSITFASLTAILIACLALASRCLKALKARSAPLT
jgi:hypothetical protein